MKRLLLAKLTYVVILKNKGTEIDFLLFDLGGGREVKARPSKYCRKMEIDFDPMEFVLVVDHRTFFPFIDHSRSWDKDCFASELLAAKVAHKKAKAEALRSQIKIGSRVHLVSTNGTYEVVSEIGDGYVINCKTWKVQGKKPRYITIEEIKCLYGGG